MKKIFALLLVLVASLSLVACDNNEDPVERTYNNDGKFTAFEVGDNYGALMVTWVDVVIKDDKIESFSIDALQSSEAGWNEKSKKELGYDYAMHAPAFGSYEGELSYEQWLKENNKLEWFEQANLIEAKWLADGVDSVTAEDIDVIAGVTVADGGYVGLAKEAVENAVAGKVVSFETGDNYGALMVTWVDVIVEDDKVKSFSIDALQSSEAGWNEKSKKELGYDYAMHAPAFGAYEGELSYEQWLKENNKLEWFEQANLIEAKWLADGVDSVKAEDIDVIAGVTVADGGYVGLAKEAVSKIK